MTEGIGIFSNTVEQARERFLIACDRIGVRVWSCPTDVPQSEGKPLFCDVARLGSPDARRIVVLCSSAGGQAGLLGCGVALGMLTKEGLGDLPRDVGLVLVHAANPRGPIWPTNATDVSAAAVQEETRSGWTDTFLTEAENRLAAYNAHDPQDALPEPEIDWNRMAERTLTSMAPPAWSTTVIRSIATQRIPRVDQICLIDVRTGIGPYGQTEVVACDPERSAGRDRAERWFKINVAAPRSQARDPDADIAPCAGGMGAYLSPARVTSVIVETGTYDMAGVLGPPGRGWRDSITAFPTAMEWRQAAWDGIRGSLRNAYAGITNDA